MGRLSPSQVFTLGRSGTGLTSGLYIAGYLIFLEHLSAKDGGQGNVVALIFLTLLVKAFLEFACDVASSMVAEKVPRFARRGVFLTGMACQAMCFVVLAAIVPLTSRNNQYLWLLIVTAEAFKAIGDAFVSGTFDGWAVSLEQERHAKFDIARMFSQAQLGTRILLVIGSLIAVPMLIWQSDGSADHHALWLSLWLIAAVLHLLLVFLVGSASSGFSHVRAAKPSDLPSFGSTIRLALTVRAMPGLILFSSLSTLAFLVTYTWSLLPMTETWGAWRFCTPTWIFISGGIGATSACIITHSRRSRVAVLAGHLSRAGLATATTAAAAILILLANLCILRGSSSAWSFSAQVVALIMILASRGAHFMADPFVSALVHESVSIEKIRAAIVSIRVATSSLVATVLVSILAVFAKSMNATHPRDVTSLLSVAFVLTSSLVLIALFFVWLQVRKTGDHPLAEPDAPQSHSPFIQEVSDGNAEI